MPKLKAKCAVCKTRPRWGRFTKCQRCQHETLSQAAVTRWRHHQSLSRIAREARTEPSPYAGPIPGADLEKLMAEADAAGAKALKVAASITLPRKDQ